MAERAAARREATPAKNRTRTRAIVATLGTQHPNADTELNFRSPYELLVATILSAQCTDERVNQVTPALFARYPDATALAKATTDELEPLIQSTGFFRAKSRSLHGMSTAIVEKHRGEVPETMEELVALPGVGRKTANVVLGHALGVPGLPVDRHVLRVANRIGIARSEDPEIVERQLCAVLPPAEWTRCSDTLILHGRRVCRPKPLCDRCAARADCDYYRKLGPKTAGRAGERRAALRGGSDRGRGAADGDVANAKTPPLERRAALRGGPDRGRGAADGDVANAKTPPLERRAALRGGSDRGRGAADGDVSNAKASPLERRAARRRGTGRGGGAPRQSKRR